MSKASSSFPALSLALALALFLAGCGCGRNEIDADEPGEPDEPEVLAEEEDPVADLSPVRPFPETFPRRAHLPDCTESEASGSIVYSSFSAGRDLVFVEDDRVWWESDNDEEDDDECDHSMHRNLQLPFRRLVEMCVASGAVLRVQEAYRPTSIHSPKSLHREGRALDLTCPSLDPEWNPDDPNAHRPSPKSLEILAKLAWAAGFDWVYYECPKNSGPHIHASVTRGDDQTLPTANAADDDADNDGGAAPRP